MQETKIERASERKTLLLSLSYTTHSYVCTHTHTLTHSCTHTHSLLHTHSLSLSLMLCGVRGVTNETHTHTHTRTLAVGFFALYVLRLKRKLDKGQMIRCVVHSVTLKTMCAVSRSGSHSTHCNTLQHTTTYCNTRCTTLRNITTHCDTPCDTEPHRALYVLSVTHCDRHLLDNEQMNRCVVRCVTLNTTCSVAHTV